MRELVDGEEVERFLRRDPWLRVYELGDLDSRLRQFTRFFGLGEPLEATCLLWLASDPPTLLCFRRNEDDRAPEALLRALAPELPRPLYAHLSPGLEDAVGGPCDKRGLHLKLGLLDVARLRSVDTSGTEQLGPECQAELEALYASAYPGSWFDPRTLSTGCYFGARRNGALVAAAGVHVVSEEQRVAALGNIVTHRACRSEGLATRVTARLSMHLLERVDHIGLNVSADNHAALACYGKLGFSTVASYEEVLFSP